MTPTGYGLRTVIIAAAMTVSAGTALAQQAPPPAHGHGESRPHAAAPVEATVRIAALDQRIAMLTADMKMFAGELKIQAMTELLEALVERQSLTDNETRWMHERMRDQMHQRRDDSQPIDLEPETLCSPFI